MARNITDNGYSQLPTLARAHNGEWRDVWTGDTIHGVTLMEAVARLRALRDAMQEDADAYRGGL